MTSRRGAWGMRPGIVVAAALLAGPALEGCSRSTPRQRAAFAQAACAVSGSTRTCELWAKAGTVRLPGGATLPIWGYADRADGSATLPGPAVVALEGETVRIVLHNALPERTALLLKGQPLPPDLAGVATGASATYTFTAETPGTYLYEAGLLPNAQHQVAMGLYGALVVRPAAGAAQAYASAATAFDEEALVVLGELDPALNGNPAPASFDMRDFAPRYRLINGKAYPATDPIPIAANVRLLLRYVNAGVEHHSMALLGLRQEIVGMDGSPRAFPYRVVAETLAPGATLDAIVRVPDRVPWDTRFALYDGSLMLHNDGDAGFGGMLTFLVASPRAPAGGDGQGPLVSGLRLTPDVVTAPVDVALTANVSDFRTGGSAVIAAEYFLDAPGASGAGAPALGAFGTRTVTVGATIPAATIGALPSGRHLVYLHGQDAAGNWGPFEIADLGVDTAGPIAAGVVLAPNPSGGAAGVALSAICDDRVNKRSSVAAGEYFLEAAGAAGSGVAMLVAAQDGTASLTASIDPTGLSEGDHPVLVHCLHEGGSWGGFASGTLHVDRTGPTTSAVVAAPNPNDGSLPLDASTAAVQVSATVTDTASSVAAAEGFIDLLGAAGAGFPFLPRDGRLDAPSEAVWSNVPLPTIALLSEGPHPIFVRGRDAAGNWGAAATTTLVIDRTAPVVTAVLASPDPTNGPGGTGSAFTLTATATDPTSAGVAAGVGAAEWFEAPDPGPGGGHPIPVASPGASVSLATVIDYVALGWAAGPHTVHVRARDLAGNWSATAAVTVGVVLAGGAP